MIPFGASCTGWMERRSNPGAPVVFLRHACLSPAAALPAAALMLALFHAVPEARSLQRFDRRQQAKLADALRRESEALVEVADGAMSGRTPRSDFTIEWRNDFLKAQPGTFVPFTLSIDAALDSPNGALLYVRMVERRLAADRRRPDAPYAYETVFPIDAEATATRPFRIRRGFAISPGRYTAYIVLSERPPDPLARRARPRRTSVLVRPLDVPDFWTGALTTSSVMLADRIEPLSAAVQATHLDEDPYVVGTSRILPSWGSTFRRQGELTVVFLVYNPSVGPDRHFDVQVDYHLYKKGPDGERYVTRTNPQRFNPSLMGAHFDPAAGQPMLAGQAIPLSEFEVGEYRLGITVTDLLSRTSVTRDVAFTVIGS